MDGQGYEKFCAGWLRKHGYHDVSLTKATGDQGIDILAFRHGKQYGFQCKYYERPVGNEAVQQAYAGGTFYDCDICAVMTNSTFTRSARSLAEETDVILMDGINPDHQKHAFSLIQILSVIISFTGVFSFSRYSQHPTMPYYDRTVWSDLALIAGGLCGLYAETHRYLCVLAILLDLTWLILDGTFLIHQKAITSVLFWCLVLILSGLLSIHFIRMIRRENKRKSKAIRKEIRQSIDQEVNQLGRHLEIMLGDELHCSITLDSAKHQADGTSTFVFHTSKDTQEDLAVLQYSLNQYAKHDHIRDYYTFTPVSSRSFKLVITKY